jgi:effector-binding domain-containing protein
MLLPVALAAAVMVLASGIPPAAAQAPTEPATSQSPAPPVPATPEPVKPADPFGEEVTLTAKTLVATKGTGNWDSAFETITEALKGVHAFVDRQGIKPTGPAMTIYTQSDDTGFQYQVGIPVAEAPKNLPRGLSVGRSPEGKALKFVHRGSYDSMDPLYDAITNHLDEKRLEAGDMFIEEYVTDPLKTAEDKLVVNIFVPLK